MKSLFLAVALLIQGPALQQTDNGVITGQILGVDGKPAIGIRVSAKEAHVETGADIDAALVRLTDTDSSGRFRLENIPTGQYYILAGSITNPTYYPGTANAANAKVLSITAGTTITALNYSLSADNQKGMIQVVVQRADSFAPISESQVTIRSDGSPPGAAATSWNTDKNGQVILGGLAAGQYTVTAQNPSYIGQYTFTGVADPHATAGVILSLEQPEARVLFHLRPAASISGKIQAEDGRPLSGIAVTVMKLGYMNGQRALVGAGGSADTRSDPQGQFMLGSLGPGEYVIRTEDRTVAQRYGSGPFLPASLSYYPGVILPADAKTVVVQDGQVLTGIDIKVPNRPETTLSGIIENTLPTGRQLPNGTTSRSVADFNVISRNGTFFDTNPPLIVNSASRLIDQTHSSFEIRGIPPGDYDVYPLFANGAGASYSTARTEIKVENQNVDNLTITLRPNSEIHGQFTIRGEIPALNPASLRLQLRLKQILPTLIRMAGSRTSAPVNPQTREFLVSDVPEGKFAVLVSALPNDVYVADIRQGTNSIFRDDTISVHDGTNEPLEIILKAGAGAIQGAVRSNAFSVAASTVLLRPAAPRSSNSQLYKRTLTDSSGAFRISGVAPGDYELYAFPSIPNGNAEESPEFMAKYANLGEKVTVDSSQTVHAELTLIADASLTPPQGSLMAPQITNKVIADPGSAAITVSQADTRAPGPSPGTIALSNASATAVTNTDAVLTTYLRQGATFTDGMVAAGEQRLLSNPDSVQDRIQLLGAYFLKQSDTAVAAKRKENILWLIRNYPQYRVAAVPESQFGRNDPALPAAREAWSKQVETHQNDAAILLNAGKFFILTDPAYSEEMLLKGQTLQPRNADFPTQLGMLYGLYVQPSNVPDYPKLPLTGPEAASKSLDEYERAYALAPEPQALSVLAEAARLADAQEKAVTYANQGIATGAPDAVHDGNYTLGKIALKQGNIEAAKTYLLTSGMVLSSPVLSSFGPRMNLANELLQRGERDTVTAYLQECLSFWISGQDRLKSWIASLQNGEPMALSNRGR